MKGKFYSPDPNKEMPKDIEEIISSAPINIGWLDTFLSGPIPVRSCQPHKAFLVPNDVDKIICLGVHDPFAYESESEECVETYSNENARSISRREKDFVYYMPNGCKVAIILLKETPGLYRPLCPRTDTSKLTPPRSGSGVT